MLNAAQCRAGRALLNWSQDELSVNAQVARSTVTEFESNFRTPMKQNLLALQSALEAAGVEFIPEDGGGVGARFRKVELEYSRNVRTDIDKVMLPIRYRSHPYTLAIPNGLIDDMDRANYKTDKEFGKALERKLPIYLRAAEQKIIAGRISDHNFVWLTHEDFTVEAF